ncbi:isoleucine--tRNA ligase, partial [candidate division WOR-3 bacterium]|nr:isoleucine--tRNA ligase [candidate division WOR-3 bacterium]
MNYKETIQLPHTDFPMRANLPEKESEILQYWAQAQIYKCIQESRKDSEPYIFHDGPPYANGHIHMGTAFNRILKDIIVKYKTMAGYKVPFIPGWDCHGMPIEREVIKELREKGQNLSNEELRESCKKFAQKFVDIQKEEFTRLGVFGEWDNPYITMDPEYEAKVIDIFRVLVENGYVYRDKRPVHWCTSCKTALAEAELEYKEIGSPSIYVKFKTQDPKGSILIWTTTPWTLPANVAVALNPKLQYDFVKVGSETLIIASDLKDAVLEKLGMKDYEIEKSVVGEELEGMTYLHPLFDKECKVILSTFVSKESGTGCVHIAPGHGYEDYQVGLLYKLPVISPVDESGCFTDEVSEFKGKYVFDADKHIIEALKKKGTLVHNEEFSHSYPHCWRCKNPLIFRATPQWFLRIDHKNLRERCVNEIENVHWIPGWSKERILHNIMDRPDWCLSRQRRWGIPIPVLYCKNCGTPVLDTKVIEQARDIIKKEGSIGWFTHPVKDFIKDSCRECGNKEFVKEKDIFDVWFDSGASWTVIKSQGLFPADLYCEGV